MKKCAQIRIISGDLQGNRGTVRQCPNTTTGTYCLSCWREILRMRAMVKNGNKMLAKISKMMHSAHSASERYRPCQRIQAH